MVNSWKFFIIIATDSHKLRYFSNTLNRWIKANKETRYKPQMIPDNIFQRFCWLEICTFPNDLSNGHKAIQAGTQDSGNGYEEG